MLSMAKNNTGNSNSSNEYGVSSKKFQQGGQFVVVELGLKLQQQQQHQDRSFLCNDHDHHERCGPTSYNGYKIISNSPTSSISSSPIYSLATPAVADSSSSPVHSSTTTTRTTTATTSPASSAAVVRGFQPPFDVCSSYIPNPSFFKSSGGGMATTAAMAYPFTAAQWRELERQAMIYKYMMASLPVPPHLLYSSFPLTNSTFAPPSYFMGNYGSGIAMRWSGNSKDAEPGRCRRTDGKKWRCSRDVAPNQKYCERHMHRGRPRSRKHVEQQQQQQTHHSSISNLSFTNSTNNNDNITPPKKTRLSDPLHHSVVQPPSKASFFAHPLGSSATPFEDSRNLAWTEEQQWNQLVHQANNMNNSSVFQDQFEGESLNLSCNGVYTTKSDDIGLLERPLIDAWSMGVTPGNKTNVENGNKMSPSCSNGGNNNNANTINEEMCQIHMGLGLIDSWVGSNTTPGGPLAEVLRPGNPAMSDAGESEFVTPPATAVSSPSGVLQRTLATFSDSSGSNSPTTCHNSRPSSDMPFRWLN